jgi:threonine dehydrogenase-like Zn-dependent dehydrogenase
MKAAVLTEYNKFEIKDMHIFSGEFHPRTPIPFIPGHEFAGRIVETGKNVSNFNVDDYITADPIIWCGKCAACRIEHYPACTSLKLLGIDLDGGFAEYVKADESMLYKVDSNIKEEHAALIEVLAIGFHACRRAGLKKNDTIAIWGTGRIGHCILQAARTITDNTIFMIDILDNRLQKASENYNNIVTINSLKENPLEIIKEKTKGTGTDIAFEAVGHAKEIKDRPNPVRGCVQSIRGAGTVCTLGLSDTPAPVVLKELIWKEAQITASRVTHGEFPEAIRNLSKGLLKPDVLISDIFPLEETQKAFNLLEKEPEKYLKVILKVS